MIGITVVIASDSNAAMPISATMPSVARRYAGESTPPAGRVLSPAVVMLSP